MLDVPIHGTFVNQLLADPISLLNLF